MTVVYSLWLSSKCMVAVMIKQFGYKKIHTQPTPQKNIQGKKEITKQTHKLTNHNKVTNNALKHTMFMFKAPSLVSFTSKRLLSLESTRLSSNIPHIAKDSLLAFNVRDNKFYKHRFIKPFEKFDNYDDVVKYIEWSYPETGLSMENHIQNITFLQKILSYRMFNSLLKLYQQRFVMIPNKYEFNRHDRKNLAKPEKLLLSLISRRYMKAKAFFVRQFFVETENELKEKYDAEEGGRSHENLQNLTLTKINKAYSDLPEEDKVKYATMAIEHQEALDKIFQIHGLKHHKEDDN